MAVARGGGAGGRANNPRQKDESESAEIRGKRRLCKFQGKVCFIPRVGGFAVVTIYTTTNLHAQKQNAQREAREKKKLHAQDTYGVIRYCSSIFEARVWSTCG